MVFELSLEDRIHFKPYISYDQLPDLYRGALALVYPSLYEGFGLPILESFACGTPVITSYGSACEEVSNNNAILVDPYSICSIADALLSVLNNHNSLKNNLLKNSHNVRTSYSWARTGHSTASILLNLL